MGLLLNTEMSDYGVSGVRYAVNNTKCSLRSDGLMDDGQYSFSDELTN